MILISLNDVKQLTGLSKTTIYKLINHKEFPGQIKIGAISRWDAEKVQNWIESKRKECTYQ